VGMGMKFITVSFSNDDAFAIAKTGHLRSKLC